MSRGRMPITEKTILIGSEGADISDFGAKIFDATHYRALVPATFAVFKWRDYRYFAAFQCLAQIALQIEASRDGLHGRVSNIFRLFVFPTFATALHQYTTPQLRRRTPAPDLTNQHTAKTAVCSPRRRTTSSPQNRFRIPCSIAPNRLRNYSRQSENVPRSHPRVPLGRVL